MISHDGKLDIPYDAVTLLNILGNVIAEYSYKFSERNILVAEYSNKEKAEKVMEMFRESYSKNQDGVFRFPSDDEVKL